MSAREGNSFVSRETQCSRDEVEKEEQTLSVLLYSDEIKIKKNIHTTIVFCDKQYKVSDFKILNLPKGFPQHFLLPAVYFSFLLDSVSLNNLRKHL